MLYISACLIINYYSVSIAKNHYCGYQISNNTLKRTVRSRLVNSVEYCCGYFSDGAEVLGEHDKLVSISGDFSLDPDNVLRGQNLLVLGTGQFTSLRGLIEEFYSRTPSRGRLINNNQFVASEKIKFHQIYRGAGWFHWCVVRWHYETNSESKVR